MIHWPPEFCQGIADRGFHVVRYDNRDVGESTCFDSPVDVGTLLAARSAGETPDVPYLLGDMAAGAVGVLDHLGIDAAHVFGVSMGGMIVQTLAIEHPDRVATLTSVMSTTGDLDVGNPTSEAMALLMSPPARSREELQDRGARATVCGSPGLYDEDKLRATAAQAWDRGYNPEAPPVNWRRSWPRAAGPQHSPRSACRRSSSTAPPTP